MQRVLVLGMAAALTAGPAAAVTTLTVEGVDIAASASGWLDPGGTAATPLSRNRRGYFSFVIMPGVHRGDAGFTGDDAGLASETRTLINYTLYDLAALPTVQDGFDGQQPSSNTAALANVYADAGSGTVYGTATVTLPTSGAADSTPPVVITLNAAGLAAVEAASAAARPFLVGVALRDANIAPAGIPEPGTWLLQIAGLGLVGAAARRQRRRLFAGNGLSAG